jgi:hypothetical protein
VRAPAIAVLSVAIAVTTAGAAIETSPPTDNTIDASLLTAFRWRHLGPLDDATAHAPDAAAPRWRVATDHSFPYRVCVARGGAVCVASRGSRGHITARDWTPIGGADVSWVAPDPVDAEVAYLSGRRVARVDRRTGQAQDVSPPRTVAHAPVAFSRADPKTLFYGGLSLWKTTTGGQTWVEIPTNVGQRAGGTIAAIASAYVDQRTIWIGTVGGDVEISRDGGAVWTTLSLPATETAAVSDIEPSHFDPAGAYVALVGADAPTALASAPRLIRTRDAGATWTPIAALAGARVAYAVREDPFRRGLLFAATDAGVFISFDDGQAWQPLRQNMPLTAVHDLSIRDADLVAVAADGGVWILDDITPLRQITADVARADVFLFRPGTTWRVRGGAAAAVDDPRPSAPNPADGVVISYLLRDNVDAAPEAPAAVIIEIIDTASGETIRRLASNDAGSALPTAAGLHRVVWDGRYAPPPVSGAAATHAPRGMFAHPGTYQLRLTVGARVVRQPIVVRLDPRVRAQTADIQLQFTLSKSVHEMLVQVAAARAEAAGRADAAALSRLDAVVAPLADVLATLQSADAKPTETAQAATTEALARAQAAIDGSR